MARISATEDITVGVVQMHRIASVYVYGDTMLRIEDRDGTAVYLDAPSAEAARAVRDALAGKPVAPAKIIMQAAG